MNTEVYSAREIARAAGVPLRRVVDALGSADILVGHEEAVRVGRALLVGAASARITGRWQVGGTVRTVTAEVPARGTLAAAARSTGEAPAPRAPMFATVAGWRSGHRKTGISLALSSTMHAGAVAGIILLTTAGLKPEAIVATSVERPAETLRLVYVAEPGPGGGGGGGGRRQVEPPPRARREGRARVSSPVPVRRPVPVTPAARPPDPPPPLPAEPLPVLAAPIVSAPADDRDRIGVFEQSESSVESHGPGEGAGTGRGAGTGLGPGDGPGLGPGSGGGTGGGPFRPGAGIRPPRLLREVKADYTEDGRRRGVEGEVLMEIVVTREGRVGDVKILRRIGAGLDDRAVQAVRQWRFEPASRNGTPVDVVVEVGVEFRLR